MLTTLKKIKSKVTTLRSLLMKGLEKKEDINSEQISTREFVIKLDYPVIPKSRYGYGKPPHQFINKKLKSNQAIYESYIKQFFSFGELLRKISRDEPDNPVEPYWENKWFEGLDPISLYCFTSIFKPNLCIEIGSGNSTKFLRRAIADNGLGTRIVSVDPRPRAEVDGICDDVIRAPLEEVDINLFDELGAGDVLIVDNSHRCFQNSDVTVVFLDILPRLKKGVLIYIDDIYLPFDYPPSWQNRFYSEQYLLAVLILSDTTRYEVILPCVYILHDKYLSNIVNKLWLSLEFTDTRCHGNGFWMIVKD